MALDAPCDTIHDKPKQEDGTLLACDILITIHTIYANTRYIFNNQYLSYSEVVQLSLVIMVRHRYLSDAHLKGFEKYKVLTMSFWLYMFKLERDKTFRQWSRFAQIVAHAPENLLNMNAHIKTNDFDFDLFLNWWAIAVQFNRHKSTE